MLKCPECQLENADDSVICQGCQTPFELSTRTVVVDPQATVTGADTELLDLGQMPELPHGLVLGGRYEIERMLGQGGMGAVYRALDREIGKRVALKLIRPDLAGNAAVLRRFKQELILARQVTHRNVIRIFDVVEAGSLKFITMEYVEGDDLRRLMKRGERMPPEQAIPLAAQILDGLAAAHQAGVVHRDLKPQNVRIENGGRAVVMDFGVARSIDEDQGVTRAGLVVGTPHYMSPEQVRGEKVDARSDLFAMGVMVYEMLTGVTPFHGDTMTGTMLKRLNEKPRPPIELDATISPGLNAAVLKALAVKPEERFQTAADMRRALENPVDPPPVPRAPALSRRQWMGASAGAAVIAGAGAGYRWWPRAASTAALKPVSLLIADFDNRSGEDLLEGTLEQIVLITLEGAPHLTSFDRGQARRVGLALQPAAKKLNSALARLVAVREGVSVVVDGAIERATGGGYSLALQAIESATGQRIAARAGRGRDKETLLKVVTTLTAGLRGGLGDTTPENARLMAAETVTSTSVEAAHAYAQAQELQLAGKIEESIQRYQHAIQLDPGFGRAYAGLAVAYRNLNRPADALKQYEQAMSHIDRMTPREKLRTRGGYYVTAGNRAKAIEEFTALTTQYPADSGGHANLALSHFLRSEFTKALEVGRHGLSIYPKNLTHRNNAAWYALFAGDFASARKDAQAASQIDPAFPKAYLPWALAELCDRRFEAAEEAYRKLQNTNARGASYAALGLADLAIARGQLAAAKTSLEAAVASDLALDNRDGAALKYLALADAQERAGQSGAAAAGKAVELSQRNGVLLMAGLAGTATQAQGWRAMLAGRPAEEAREFAVLLDAELARRRANPREAIRLLNTLAATHWLRPYLLGRAHLDAGEYVEAQEEFDATIQRRGEAASLLRDDMPMFRFVPDAYYWLARSLEALKSPGAGAAYRNYLEYKTADEETNAAHARQKTR